MKRNTIAAIVAAAVLGTTGGVALAAKQGAPRTAPPASSNKPTTSTSTPTTTPSKTPTSTGTPTSTPTTSPKATNLVSGEDNSTNEPLLYVTKTDIHDGSHVVGINDISSPAAIVRMTGGYVVADATSTQSADYDLWFVRADGHAAKLGAITGEWDANAAGTKVVGRTPAGPVAIWTIETGTKQVWSRRLMSATYASFMGEKVLVSLMSERGIQMFRWDPAADTTTELPSVGFAHMALSPGGSYLTGNVDNAGVPVFDGNCLHLQNTSLRKTPATWSTCDWRPNGNTPQFSPDGKRLLAIPYNSDGFGPGLFAVIDASDGPSSLVARVPMPDWTLGAEFADNDHLYVYGTDGSDLGDKMFIDACDFKGSCKRLVNSPTRVVVARTR